MAKIDAGEINSIRLKEQGSAPSTPASGYGQLYCKADGLYFKGDDGVEIGPFGTGGAGGLTLITRTVVDASVDANFDFTSIPGTYYNLRLVITARTDNATTDQGLFLRFNNDAGANQYVYENLSGNAATVSSARTANTQGQIGGVPGSTGVASTPSITTCIVPNYAATVFNKMWMAETHRHPNTGTNEIRASLGGVWLSTAAITRITVLPAAGNFIQDSVAELWGES